MKEYLLKIVSKNKLSKEDKMKVVEYSKLLNIEFIKTDCPDCHKDQAIILLKKLTEKDPEETNNRPKLRDRNVDIIFRGIRVNHHTITEEIAQQLRGAGLSKFLFNEK